MLTWGVAGCGQRRQESTGWISRHFLQVQSTQRATLTSMRLSSRHYPQLAEFISAPLVRISKNHPAHSARLIYATPSRKSDGQTLLLCNAKDTARADVK